MATILAKMISMIVLVAIGIYAVVAGIIGTYVGRAFCGGFSPFIFLIISAIGLLLIWAGFYISPFMISFILVHL